ncbi:DNA polymerase alpha catalytic subunit [Halotydeus destructor]|nr:DNA polymerase alpha catalytic subunit [Halotydeus destructor]
MADTSRSRRQRSSRKEAASAACERLKQLKGSKNKYELREEAPVYEMVDEHEYAKLVVERQKDDWIVDDAGIGGYVEDGREVFDDEADEDLNDGDLYDEDSEVRLNKNKKKVPVKRKRLDEDDESPVKKVSIVKMFKQMEKDTELRKRSKRKEEAPVNDDDLLNDIINGLDGDEKSETKQVNQVVYSNMRPLKLKKKPMANIGTKSILKSQSKDRNKLPMKSVTLREFDALDIGDISPMKNSGSAGSKSSGYDSGAERFDDDGLDSSLVEIFQPSAVKKPIFDTEWEHSGQNNDFNSAFTVGLPSELSEELEFEGTKTEKHIKFFWYDAHENHFVTPGVVYLFGKVYMKQADKYVSCCITVRNVERRIYLLPRTTLKSDPDSEVAIDDLYAEFNAMSKKYKIKSFRSRPVTKKYAGNKTGIPSESEYLEVLIPASASLPADLEGDSFKCIFGSNQSVLERLILDLKLRGPSWLKVKCPTFVSSPVSWCKVELSIEKLNQLSFDSEDKTPAPPLTLMSISMQTVANPQNRQSEIVAISCLIDREFNIEKGSSNQKLSGKSIKFDTHFCALTKPSPATGIIFPYDLNVAKAPTQYTKTKLEIKSSERELLNFFMAKFGQIDPDIIVGHDIQAFDFEVLLSRMVSYKVAGWSKLGRLRRSGLPSLKRKDKGIATAGRIVADLKISARELIKAKSYDLSELSNQVLKKKRQEIDRSGISGFYSSAKSLFDLVTLTMMDNSLILDIVLELSVLPMSLQITKVAGNLLSRTLLGGRSERNEFLLLHAFTEKNFLVPDKSYYKNPAQESKGPDVTLVDDTEAVIETKGAGKKKAAYAGGLVLEPKVGYYNDYILIMDFNSLYPSIMREFNICFTTVNLAAVPESQNGEQDQLPPLPDKDSEAGILPIQITKLIESRREVKKLMKNEKLSPEMRAQYDIKQMALKLTANSMYGCLGFAHSRFYAKPLAALITSQGRSILMDTKTLVENMGLEVIYGDTDSIMINTKSNEFNNAYGTSAKVQSNVNGLYKYLEIECDGILKSMLLLKKKKYAALVATVDKKDPNKIHYTKELKGLDIVRRDWSVIAKLAGESVVDQILSVDKTQDTIIDNIHEHLRQLAASTRAGQVPLKHFEITKQLTKNPEDYPDKKNLSHVSVALRFNESSKNGKKLRGGDVVPYIICEKSSNPANFNGLPATQRAFHPDELSAAPEELRVDVHYYLSQQIHPVVSRLCEPIQGTDSSVIAEMLGLTSEQVPSSVRHESPADRLLGYGDTKYDTCKSLMIKCPVASCGQQLELRKLFTKPDNTEPWLISGRKYDVVSLAFTACPHCSFGFTNNNYHYPETTRRQCKSVITQLEAACRFLVSDYYACWMTCEDPICNFKTRLATGEMTKRGPLCPECKNATLQRDMSEGQLYHQLSFWESLFDLVAGAERTYDDAYKAHILNEVKGYSQIYERLLEVVRSYKNKMAFNQVNLDYLFRNQYFKSMREKARGKVEATKSIH